MTTKHHSIVLLTLYLLKLVVYMDPEETVLQFVNSKYMPCSLYALEARPVNRSQEKSTLFTVNRTFK